jgi:hypothetical protein
MAIGEICSREVVFIARSESCAQAARSRCMRAERRAAS